MITPINPPLSPMMPPFSYGFHGPFTAGQLFWSLDLNNQLSRQVSVSGLRTMDDVREAGRVRDASGAPGIPQWCCRYRWQNRWSMGMFHLEGLIMMIIYLYIHIHICVILWYSKFHDHRLRMINTGGPWKCGNLPSNTPKSWSLDHGLVKNHGDCGILKSIKNH